MTALQRGLITDEQLRAGAVTRATVRGMVRDGTLYRAHARVHALAMSGSIPLSRETAACLHIGHDLALSHRSCAELWELMAVAAHRPVSLTLVGRGLRPRDGLVLHRVAGLHPADVGLRHGLPVTSPARALIDLAATEPAAVVGDALAAARVRGLVSDRDLHATLARAPFRTGTAPLSRLLATPVGRAVLRSQFERRLLELIDAARLPRPAVNAIVNGHEVDFVWWAERVILEADSWTYHGDRRSFERDRARDQHQAAHGFVVLRITWRQLTEDPLGTIAAAAGALAAGR